MEVVLRGVLAGSVALAGFAVVRRVVPLDVREAHNGNTAVALYVIYGLIVRLPAYFVSCLVGPGPEERAGRRPKGRVEEIHRIAEGFPAEKRLEVRGLARSEARVVGRDALYSQALRLLEVKEGIPAAYLMGGPDRGLRRRGLLHEPARGQYGAAARVDELRLILYTIRALDHPFDGLVQVGLEAFETALSKM